MSVRDVREFCEELELSVQQQLVMRDEQLLQEQHVQRGQF